MSFLGTKVRRACEACYLMWKCAADNASRKTLFDCYTSIFRDVGDQRIVDFRLVIAGAPFAFRMRRNDIFTLGEVFFEKQYELNSGLPDHPVIIDAGANIGVTALWFLSRFPDATIHAFEPAPDNFQLLETNFRGNGRVRLNRAGLTAEPGRRRLYLGDHSAVHSFCGESPKFVEVDCCRLDGYMRGLGLHKVDLLKLDVEGLELEVLRGLGDDIGRVGLIVGEVHEALVDQAEFYGYLQDHGFRIVQRHIFASGTQERVHGFEAARSRPC